MSEFAANLTQYKSQLKQVEAALAAEPNNDELLKLKANLEEVMKLTQDLVQLNTAAGVTPGSSQVVPDAISSTMMSSSASNSTHITTSGQWSVGSRCQAVWSVDGQYYNATIVSISSNGLTCTVAFERYDHNEVVQLSSLRRQTADGSRKRHADEAIKQQRPSKSRAKREAEKEYKRKKALKKAQRIKEIEDEREKEKSRWKQFTTKAGRQKGTSLSSKQNIQKKSIFASPDTVNGRVGVGTCGVGGKEMTQFSQPESYRREAQL
ncbi:survival of motor neuron-related-splicing factor 30-like [Corticium candelabrum]|uniref:survival of motor neuron-related-splicing factor 30-like n=1 Tax=Corticium candelabrum TaxID=121492 RepID=UPI002E253273|nr:survival of motor neuron-related-splicing factor 30-like [Corticium candelabrum]